MSAVGFGDGLRLVHCFSRDTLYGTWLFGANGSVSDSVGHNLQRKVVVIMARGDVWHVIECTDARCNWKVHTRSDPNMLLENHLAMDPRHTNGSWTDRDGVTHVGLGDFDAN